MNNAMLLTETLATVSNNRHQSKRPLFEYDLKIERRKNGHLTAQRKWRGVGQTPIAIEEIVWCPIEGLLQANMEQPFLNEVGQLTVSHSKGVSRLTSDKTAQQEKKKNLSFNTFPCTLLSIPFEIALHWKSLEQGHKIKLDYTVLKVQAHTGVTLSMQTRKNRIVVSVTPEKWFWRMLFGSTQFYFDKVTQHLVKIEGLLEPRDKSLKGKYIEYLGLAEFNRTVDFALIKEYVNG